MDIPIQNDPDREITAKRKRLKTRPTDPLKSIIIKTLICILVIDATIWGYFVFVKNVTLGEGLKNWESSIRHFVGINETASQPKIKTRVVINKFKGTNQFEIAKKTEVDTSLKEVSKKPLNIYTDLAEIEKRMQRKILPNEQVYCWKDSNGAIHYSNTGFPKYKYIEKLWIRKASNILSPR